MLGMTSVQLDMLGLLGVVVLVCKKSKLEWEMMVFNFETSGDTPRLDWCSNSLQYIANVRVSGNQSGDLPKSTNHNRWLPSPIRDSCKVIGTSSNPQIVEFVRKWSMDEVAMCVIFRGIGDEGTSV